MPPNAATPCLIYCRVSSRKQLDKGDGLRGQEKRCRDYAALKGYQVLRVFREEAVTGATNDRPAMTELQAYLETLPGEVVVIVDDIKRFARDVELHFALKLALMKRGGRLESPLFRFEDSPEGKFIETIVAAQAELERNQNKRQVRGRMQARLEQGFWTFNVPPGYKYARHPHYKAVLVIDTECVPLVKEALEGFAQERFASPSDIVRFLAEKGFYGPNPRLHNAKYLGQIKMMLQSVLYAGYLEYKPWGISLRKAHHPGIISLATHLTIQQKLARKMTTLTRKDRSADFVLRNFVACATCGRLLTGSWTRGRSRRYAYYHCQERSCPQFGKTINRDILEAAFASLLQGLEVSDRVLDATKQRALEEWQKKQDQHEDVQSQRQAEVRRLEQDLQALADKLARTTSDVVSRTLEARIEELSREHALLVEETGDFDTERTDFGTAFEQVRHLLRNPYLIWKEGDLDTKRLVVRLVFTGRLQYDRNTGFGTVELSLPYLISARIAAGDSALVDLDLKTWNQFEETILQWSQQFNSRPC